MQLDGQVGPRLGAVAHHELELREVPADLVDQLVSWQADGTRGPEMPVQTQIGMSSSMHLA